LSEAKPIASVAIRKDEMTNYRRNFVAGGSFFTVNLAERRLLTRLSQLGSFEHRKPA
jgi:hypothetical protein